MELRSGTRVVSGYSSAEAARAACMGQARTQLEDVHRPPFVAAVRGVLSRWTALRLAVDNEWGGENSNALAEELESSCIGWFCSKGDHYPDELEEHLDDFLQEEFRVECEDGSCREVAHLLVHTFELCAKGDYVLAQELARVPVLTPLERSVRDESDSRWTLQHGAARPPDAPARRADANMSEDDLAAALGGMSAGGGEPMAMVEEEEQEPLEDGWERVPTKKKGSRARG